MAYITQLAVTGLAGRKKRLHYRLDRHVAIFWGLNGSGKTSLLRIIHAAMNDEAASLQRIPFETAELHFYHESTKRRYVRKIDMTESLEAATEPEMIQVGEDEWDYVYIQQERKWQTSTVEGVAPKVLPGVLQHTYLPISRVAENRGPRRPAAPRAAGVREAMNDAYFDAVFADQVRRRWLTYNAEANATIRDVQQQGLAEILSLLFGGAAGPRKHTAAAPDVEVAYALVREFLTRQGIRLKIDETDFRERYQLESDLPLIVSRIQEVLSNIDQALAPQRQLQNLIEDLYSGDKRLQFDSRGLGVTSGTEAIPLESLSSGEKQLLQILLETLASGRAPVIIDEPELSMHVDWQNRLVGYMRVINPDCQLILATHSPEVMAEVADKHIHQL